MIGAGNVATNISRHFHSSGHIITCVYSRSRESALQLAGEFGSVGTADSKVVPFDADFFLVCVPDRVVPNVVRQFRDRKGTWLHTSGALSMEVFKDIEPPYGVLYPLQTLSKQRRISLEATPILVEGSSAEITDSIKGLALTLSKYVVEADAATRLLIHLAAVFANNFSNHMVHLAEQILEEKHIERALLMPLLKETFNKLQEMGAADAQTGPALRGDQETMHKHLELLKEHPEWQKLYTFISRDINRSRN